jgi:hypothetical protein
VVVVMDTLMTDLIRAQGALELLVLLEQQFLHP